MPVVIEVMAVAVVEGTTVRIGEPGIEDSAGVSARRWAQLVPPEAVEHEQDDLVGHRPHRAGARSGVAPASSSAGTTLATHAPA